MDPSALTLATARTQLITGINASCQMMVANPQAYGVPFKQAEIVAALGELRRIGFGPNVSVLTFRTPGAPTGIHNAVSDWIGANGINKGPLPPKPQIDTSSSMIRFGDLAVEFQRTLRLPDDGRTYPLPAGLGAFPLVEIKDLGDRVPASWRETGGVAMPMDVREAMWINFTQSRNHIPHAVKVAAGMINAVSGRRWHHGLNRTNKDYLVAPEPQRWLDGFNAGQDGEGQDIIRQFVAMPLGAGYTVEKHVTGEETFGGVQLMVFRPRTEHILDKRRFEIISLIGALSTAMQLERPPSGDRRVALRFRGGTRLEAYFEEPCVLLCASAPETMGLAAGGRMRQEIYRDPHGYDFWERASEASGRLFVRLIGAADWHRMTGQPPPTRPITKADYERHRIPWFEIADEGMAAVNTPATPLADVPSVGEQDAAHGMDMGEGKPVDTTKGPLVTYPAPGKGGEPTVSKGGKPNNDGPKIPGAVDEGTWGNEKKKG